MISPAQRLQLKRALQVGCGDDGVQRVQRFAIRELCSSAQARALTPEQFVISMKATLNEVANDARLPFGRERDDLLFTLVRMSIEEFFGASADGTGVDDVSDSPASDSVARPSPGRRTVRSVRKKDDECRGSR